MRSITYRSGCDAGRQLGEGPSGSRRDGGTVERKREHMKVDVIGVGVGDDDGDNDGDVLRLR